MTQRLTQPMIDWCERRTSELLDLDLRESLAAYAAMPSYERELLDRYTTQLAEGKVPSDAPNK